MMFFSHFIVFIVFTVALAKESVSDQDMAEMIGQEIESLSNELKNLEEKLMVLPFLNFYLLQI